MDTDKERKNKRAEIYRITKEKEAKERKEQDEKEEREEKAERELNGREEKELLEEKKDVKENKRPTVHIPVKTVHLSQDYIFKIKLLTIVKNSPAYGKTIREVIEGSLEEMFNSKDYKKILEKF